MDSVVAPQPYLRPSADTPVARKGVYQLLTCAPAILGTHVVERISREQPISSLAGSRAWPQRGAGPLAFLPSLQVCYDHARRAGGRGSFLKSKDRTSGI